MKLVYKVICLKDINEYKLGKIYDIYKEEDKIFLRLSKTKNPFKWIFSKFETNYFHCIEDSFSLNFYDEEKCFLNNLKHFFKRPVEKDWHTIKYNFSKIDRDTLALIQSNVYIYIFLLNNLQDEHITDFKKVINNSLNMLLNIYGKSSDEEYKGHIQKVSDILKGIYDYLHKMNINKLAEENFKTNRTNQAENLKVTEALDKYNHEISILNEL